ncbi:hypothetical protein [Streptomyces justiciae]|uniref:Uncharacterized protein n=1 Tax=Streptomyces justiciae TaxID=2780140 RepID=A0ABU3M4U9_9ACTN|nr:hypothetical protein [Streptomyces justiciae]MDT7846071.1 hypothetical protein [Streptomyces justiciae]
MDRRRVSGRADTARGGDGTRGLHGGRGTRAAGRWEWHSGTSFLDNPGKPLLLAGGYVFPRRGGASVEDAIAVGLRTRRTAWTLKTVDAEADDVQLLTDGRTLYVLGGTRLRAYPLT